MLGKRSGTLVGKVGSLIVRRLTASLQSGQPRQTAAFFATRVDRALGAMSATGARAHDPVNNRPRVDWLTLEDDVWRAVAKFLRLDVYTLRRTCKALRRILPLADVPKAVQRARQLATHMRNLDNFRAPMGTTAENLLERKYSVGNARRVPLYPSRSNALRTVHLLLETPLGELCEVLRALRESSPQLKIEFVNWRFMQPVSLALRHRCIALRNARVMEHLPGSYSRALPRAEFAEGVKLFCDLGLICNSPTCVELCQLWFMLACFGHHELMRDLWERQFTERWDAHATLRRRRALLTWRCSHENRHALEATTSAMECRLQDAEERFGDDAGTLEYLKGEIMAIYSPTIALLTKLRAEYLTPAMRTGPFVSEFDG